jgi:hypothetical protein
MYPRIHRLSLPLWVALAVVAVGLGNRSTARSGATDAVRFAVIGDYGGNTPGEAAVAALVKTWNPDFIITTGDNNYPAGAADTIDINIGQYYHDFIFPYTGAYGPGAATNRFFPALGDHDWLAPGAAPYLAYFVLPGNERYYEFARGPVRFFALDNVLGEPDGHDAGSVQAAWLRARLAAAPEPWKIVYGHWPAYSSGRHGSTPSAQWPYQAWGATTVLAGHDHTYERIVRNGFPYFVNGLGGRLIYELVAPVAGSRVFYNGNFGAMVVDADVGALVFRFVAVDGTVVDTYTIPAPLFADVPAGVYKPAIEALFRAGVTGGCATSPLHYCPGEPVTREQMAVFLLKAALGESYTPPPCTAAPFRDVSCASPFAPWIQDLVARGITAGCGGDAYCPTRPVTRAEMAVFLLRSIGAGPATCTGAGPFADVPCASAFAGWIQALVTRGITAGCEVAVYCPADPVTREQMAVLVARTFVIAID